MHQNLHNCTLISINKRDYGLILIKGQEDIPK